MEQVAPDPNKAFDAAIQTVEDEWTMVRPISAGAALGPAVLEGKAMRLGSSVTRRGIERFETSLAAY
ncbi:hypothetical protein PI126_g6644 [Phytophthora idaei]|nr:hypothetical protein PI126_g6644 [Phytophthora idaei]